MAPWWELCYQDLGKVEWDQDRSRPNDNTFRQPCAGMAWPLVEDYTAPRSGEDAQFAGGDDVTPGSGPGELWGLDQALQGISNAEELGRGVLSV